METVPETPPRPRRWLRGLLIFGLIMATAVWLYFRDEALEPADDLLPQRPSAAGVPEEQNGWVQWQKVCESLPAISRNEQERIEQVFAMELPADPERHAAMALDDPTVRKLESVIDLPLWRNQWARTAGEVDFEDKMLAPLAGLDARLLGAVRSRDTAEVLRLLEIVARFRQKMMAGGTSYVDFIHGLRIRTRLPLVLAIMDFTESDLARMAAGLVLDSCTTADLHEVMRHEHRMRRASLLEMDRAELRELENLTGGDYSAHFYQKHATANMLAKQFRPLLDSKIENMIAPGGSRKAPLPDEHWLSQLSPNRTGEKLAAGSFGELLLYPRIRSRTAEQRCLRVLVALHRHWKATGSLPDDLSALVPRFIDEVPANPYDLQPLRWDKTARVVYAAGDQNGPTSPDFLAEVKHGSEGGLKLVAEGETGGIGVRFRRPEEGPDVPVK